VRGKINIVMIGPFSSLEVRGGIASVIASYLDSSLIERYEIHYLHTSSGSGPLGKLNAFFQATSRLIYLIVQKDIKVVHIHTASWRSFYRKSVFVFLTKLLKTKVLLHIHGGEFNLFFNTGNIFQKRIISYVLDISNHIVVLSKAWLPDIQRMTKNQKLTSLSNPVNMKYYQRDFKQDTDSSSKFEIIFLGGLIRAKGIYDLLESFPQIVKQVPNARLHLCGTGPIEKLKMKCSQLGVENSVVFHGWVSGESKISRILNSDLLILPSYNEGLPVSVIEAMAAGLPVVCTPVGGVPDIFVDGENGFFFTPGDQNALVERVLQLAQNPDLRLQMGRTNYVKARELFDLEKIINQLDSLYLDLSKEE